MSQRKAHRQASRMAGYAPAPNLDFGYEDEHLRAGDWKKVMNLGSGGFGTVTLWVNEDTNEKLAIKKCKVQTEMSEKHKSRWKLEVNIMQRLQHDNVVSALYLPDCIKQVFEQGLPLMGMEYCSGGDLRKLLLRTENCCGLPEHIVRNITADITAGMEYLHSKKIIHRDIKPENVVIQRSEEKPVYKLIDLGYAKDLNEGSVCTSFVGTLQYLAPELMDRQKYTSSVDFWSLGIIVFECITGFRPFFHNESPVRTHHIVQRKAPDDIWASKDADGNPMFIKKLPPINNLCRTSRAYFEQFLRLVLLYEPKMRGGGFGENKRPKCFLLLDNILSMKLIHILDVASNRIYSYPAPETHRLEDVQKAVVMEIKMPLPDQELLLPTGMSPDPQKNATLCGDPEGEEENIVFLFRKGQTRFVKNERKNVILPSMVQQMVQDPQLILPYQKQKEAWAHSIFFCKEQAKEYKRLLQAQRALMLSLLRNNSTLSKLKTSMSNDLNSLKAKTEFSRESLQLDLVNYEQQAQGGGITSEKIFNNWKRMLVDLEKLGDIEKLAQGLEENSVALNTKNVELQRSPYSKAKQFNEFEKSSNEAVEIYERLRKVPRDQRPQYADNTPMVKIIVKCVTQRQACLSDLYQHLEKLSATKLEIVALIPKIKDVLTQIEDASKKLSKNQELRQSDVWRLLSVSVQKSKKLPTSGSTSDLGSMSRSMSQTSSTKQMSSVFDRVTQQSMSLRTFSVDTRQQMDQAVSSMIGTNQTKEERIDWSFLEDASSFLQSLS